MTAVPRTGFDLLTEAWIPVRRLDGGGEELGLLDVLRRAHELRGIGGELPTTGFALIRLLLAILYRSFQPDGDPVDIWGELWAAPRLPADLIGEYLSDHTERFDLLHPTTPFYQVATLRTGKGETSGLEKLIADVPNGAQFFTTRAGPALRSISFGEAARWLVHAQAFDPSGIKSGANGDVRVKGGKGYPIGIGWAGNIGGLVLERETLRETLLLNLVLADLDRNAVAQPETDLPVWERAPLSAATEVINGRPHNSPVGPADLLTWPSRRIRLAHNGEVVTGVLLCNGDPLAGQSLFVEPMTTWRRSEPQEKKLGGRVYMPRTHSPARSMWRGLGALVPRGVRENQRSEGAPSLPATSLEWLAMLQLRGVIDPDLVVHARAIGMAYGSNNSVVDEIVDDAVTVHAVLFGENGRELAERAISAVTATDQAVTAVANLAGNLVVAAGGDSTGARDRAREDAYFVLDAPFRTWLAALDSRTDPTHALYGWFYTARQTLRGVADVMVASAGPTAWVGRDNSLGRHVDTPLADAWFRSALRKALPDPDPDLPGDQHGKDQS